MADSDTITSGTKEQDPAEQNFAKLKEYLGENWEQMGDKTFHMPYTPQGCKLPRLDIDVQGLDNGYAFYIRFPLNSGKDDYEGEIMKLMMLINNRVMYGNYNYSPDNGAIYYQYVSFEMSDGDTLKRIISMCLTSVERYADALLEVMFGLRSAEEAFELVLNRKD